MTEHRRLTGRHFFSPLVLIVSVIYLSGCSMPVPFINQTILKNYATGLEALNPEKPGWGFDPGRTEQELDHAMSYALFASSEAKRFNHTKDTNALANAILASKWLMTNVIQASSGDVGWGLPFSWDAFADGSINDENTTYTITTALGILGLLDVYDVLKSTSKDAELSSNLLLMATRAAETFAKGKHDRLKSEIVFWYSNHEQDSYHVFNVTAMMLGAFQRLSTYVPEPDQSTFQNLADKAARYVLQRVNYDSQNRVYWNYGGDKFITRNRTNDSVHEAYVYHGLLNYKLYGGTLSTSIDLTALLKATQRFIGINVINEWAREENSDRPARLWGAGYLLFTTSLIEQQLNVNSNLSSSIYCLIVNNYFDKTKQLWRYRPDLDDDTIYPRHITHLLLGLSSILVNHVECPVGGKS